MCYCILMGRSCEIMNNFKFSKFVYEYVYLVQCVNETVVSQSKSFRFLYFFVQVSFLALSLEKVNLCLYRETHELKLKSHLDLFPKISIDSIHLSLQHLISHRKPHHYTCRQLWYMILPQNCMNSGMWLLFFKQRTVPCLGRWSCTFCDRRKALSVI